MVEEGLDPRSSFRNEGKLKPGQCAFLLQDAEVLWSRMTWVNGQMDKMVDMWVHVDEWMEIRTHGWTDTAGWVTE